MKSSIKALIYSTVFTTLLVASQISTMTTGFAVDQITPQGTSGDLSISVATAAKERGFAILITNNGTDPVIGFTLDVEFTNFSPTNLFPLPGGFGGGSATDNGTYDINTGVWAGDIEAGEAVAIGAIGEATGAVGETITLTATIISSTLGDSTPNVDPNSGNDTITYETDPIVLDPNITLGTRLVTTGTIGSGDDVQYELTVSNTGAGAYVDDGGIPMGVYFIIPEGTTFVDVEDQDITDNLGITNCGSLGNVNGLLPAFAGYNSELVGCQISFSSGDFPAGYSFKLNFNMTASGPFASGDTQVVALLVGDDADSLLVQTYMYTPNADPFGLVSDNAELLSYDGTALVATVNRCSGTGKVVSTNTACFTISFNKEIYAPSFDKTDIVVTNGEVDSLTQVGDNLWEIRLKNLVAGKVVSVSLSSTNDILDYSAVLAETQVLGINTVRYEVEGAAASAGELPSTGLKGSGDLWQYALSMLLVGFALLSGSKRNQKQTI